MNLGKIDKAVKHYTEITEKYATSDEAAKASASISRAEAMQ
jgi:hypothetical protein